MGIARRLHRKVAVVATLTVASVSHASLAWAEQQPSPAASRDAEEGEAKKQTLTQDIVVNGYRVESTTSATGIVTSVLDTPMSVSAITDKFIRDTGASRLMDTIGSMTGVNGQSNSGETGGNFSARGFAVAPQVDGFNTLSVAGGLGSSVAVERIEVLKGPSAVFNGNVPPGGTINIIYKRASYKPEAFAELTGGSWSYFSGQIFATGPLVSDKIAYLVDAYYKDADGWVNYTGHKEKTFVGGLRIDPTDTIRIDLGYRRAEHDMQMSTLPVSHQGYIGSGAPYAQPLDAWVAQNYGPLEPPQTITVPQYLPAGRRDNPLGPDNYNRATLSLYSAGIHWSPNEHIEFRDTFMYQKYTWDLLGILQSGAKVIGADGRSSVLSGLLAANIAGSGWENKLEAAFHFDTGPIQHQMLLGYQLAHSQNDHLGLWIGGAAKNAAGQPWDYFADGPRRLGPEFAALRGVFPKPMVEQFDTAKVRTHAFYIAEQASALDGRIGVVVGGRYTKTETDGLGVDDFTPQVAVQFKPFAPDSMFGATSIFFNYSESFTPSGLVQPGTTQVVPPQKGVGKEIGIKTAWFGGKLASTFSYFNDRLTNIATPDYSQQGNGGLAIYHLGGAGRSEGGEAEVVWTPNNSFQISANYTYLPVARYTSYPNVPQQQGLRFPSTPRHTFNLTTRYTFTQGPLAGAYLGGWLHTQSSTRGVLAADWQYNVVIPTQTDVEAFVGKSFGQLELRLNVKNLLNRQGYLPNNAFQPQPPRSALLTLRFTP